MPDRPRVSRWWLLGGACYLGLAGWGAWRLTAFLRQEGLAKSGEWASVVGLYLAVAAPLFAGLVWLLRRVTPDQRDTHQRERARGQHVHADEPALGGEGWDGPRLVSAIPLPADCYQDRTAVVAALDGADPVVRCQVLSGLGGVGKTQLAANFCRQQLQSGTVDLLVWVSASSRGAIQATYAQAVAEVTGSAGGNDERDADRFVSWLNTTTRRWLVVLDDLTDPADMRGLWPTGPTGRTLITTRRRDAVLATQGRRVVEVGLFTHRESVEYLTAKLGGDHRRLDQVADLAEDLGRLPLALAQSAAFLQDHAGETCAGYRTRFADRRRSLAEVLPADALADDYRSTVAATWSLSVDAADRMVPIGWATLTLRLAAVLDPNGAPEAVFSSAPAVAYLSGRRTDPRSGDALDALTCLHRFNLVTYDPTTQARSVRTHALVQRAVLERIPPEQVDETVRAAADALLHTWPDVERDTDLVRALRDSTERLRQRHESALWSDDGGAHPVLLRMGTSLGDSGLVHMATEYWSGLATGAQRTLGPDHPGTLALQANLAYWRAEAGDPAGALSTAENLAADQTRVLGRDHPDTLVTRANLAYWRGQAGDPARAANDYAQYLSDRIRVLGPDHVLTLSTRAGLAYWQGEAGDAAGAAGAFERLLVDRIRVLGPAHPDTLTTRAGLAYWQGEAGDPAGAAGAFERLLVDRIRVLGPDHHDTLMTRANLAYWQGRTSDPVAAATAFADLLPDMLPVLGAEHPHTLAVRANLAYWRGRSGEPAEAATRFADLLDDMMRLLGPDHPQTLAARANLARWQGEAGDPGRAAGALAGLLPEVVRVLGPDHPDTLVVRHSLARWQGEAGDPAGAATAFGELLPDMVRVLGPNHPDTLTSRASIASWQGEAGDPAGAASMFAHLLTDTLRLLGPDHPDTLAVRRSIARWRRAAGQPAGAVDQPPTGTLPASGPRHPDVLTTAHTLAYWRGRGSAAAD